MKKIISVLLAAFMLLSSLGAFAVFAEDEKVCDCEHMPLIYVFGKQTIYDDPSSPNRVQLDGIDSNWAKEVILGASKQLAKGAVTNDYSEFCDILVAAFEERYSLFKCKDNGDLPDNSTGVDYSWSPETMIDDHVWDNVYSYVYIYDAREDPLTIADDMHEYIESVRRVTGHRKVAILTRCMGTEMALAYFAKYGWEDIDTFFSYSSAALGTTIFSELFAGKTEIDLDSLNNYYGEKHQYDNDDVSQVIRTMLESYSYLKGLGLTEKKINSAFKAIMANALPRILRSSFATSPGYWSMVGPRDYEDAKNFLFGSEGNKYDELIARLDEYDRLVRQPMNDLIKEMNKDVKICILAKYGFQIIPLTVSQHEQSDDKISMYDQSFGATGAEYGSTFSDKYIAEAKAKGTDKYISPDRIIDASTALLPDQTWFVKNIRHNDFPGQFYDLVIRMTRADRQLTVNDDPEFPQYTTYYWSNGHDYWAPMTNDNMNTEYGHMSFFQAIRAFFQRLFSLLSSLVFRR